MRTDDQLSVAIARLRSEIEKSTDHAMLSPRDFDWLSLRVQERTGKRVSPTTLKRLWGYMRDGGDPRRSTLDILVRFLGYASIESLLKDGGNSSSLMMGDNNVDANNIEAGSQLNINWPPNRRITVVHHGGARFEVVEAENTKLCVGDTFTCHMFIEHQPLYLSCVVHQGGNPVTFVAGKHNGITIEML